MLFSGSRKVIEIKSAGNTNGFAERLQFLGNFLGYDTQGVRDPERASPSLRCLVLIRVILPGGLLSLKEKFPSL
jgi:hypothetical protein